MQQKHLFYKPATQQSPTPICHSVLFRTTQTNQYIDVSSNKSFSKSNQKKLKLLTPNKENKSLQKYHLNISDEQNRRKIKPLKVIIHKNSTQQQKQKSHATKSSLCSIKNYKTKINRITQDSNHQITQNKFVKTQNTDFEESQQIRSINKIPTVTQSPQGKCNSYEKYENSHCHKPNNTNQSTKIFSFNQSPETLATTNNSLVIKQQNSTRQNLFQSIEKILKSELNQTEILESPSNQVYKNQMFNQEFSSYQTPQKQIKSEYFLKDNSLSTAQTLRIPPQIQSPNKRKQKLTLNMARKVQTFQTLKTENDVVNYSFIDDGSPQYLNLKILNKIAFPNYFSPKNQNSNGHRKLRLQKI